MAPPQHPPGTLPSLETLGRRALWLIALGAAAYGALLVWDRLSLILLPLAIGLVLAALLQPVVDGLERRRVPRWLGGILVPVGVLLVFLGLIVAILPALVVQMGEIGRQVAQGVERLPSVLRDLGLRDAQIQDAASQIVDNLQAQAGALSSRLGTGVLIAAQGLASAFTTLFLTAVVLVYVLVSGRTFATGIVRLLPPERRARALEGGRQAWRATALFTRGQVLVAGIDGVGIALGLWLIGVPLAAPIGVLTFATAFIPYVGPIVAGLVAGLVGLSAGGVELMLGAGVVALIVQQLEGQVVYPLVMGRTLRLHPLAVLIAVGVGSAAIGLAGAFLSTPLLAAVAAGFGYLTLPEKGHRHGGWIRERWRRRDQRHGADGDPDPDVEADADDGPDGDGDGDGPDGAEHHRRADESTGRGGGGTVRSGSTTESPESARGT